MVKDSAERRLVRGQTGQSLAELPIVLVLFLVVTFGIVDAARLIYAYDVVSLSAREAVRYAVVRGSSSAHPASVDDIKAVVQSNTVGVQVNTGDIDVTWENPSTNDPGSTVVVTVRNTYSPIAPFPFVPKSIHLASSSKMVISR